MRRRILCGGIGSLFVVPGAVGNAASATDGDATALGAPSGVTVKSFSLTNWNGAGTSIGFARLGMVFKRGDVPAGASIQVRRGTSVIDAQFDERVTWSDGSLKFAVCHLRDSVFPPSSARTYDVQAVAATPFQNAGTKTLEGITGAHDFKVTFTGMTQTNSVPTTSKVGSGAFTASFKTHMAVATRHEKYHNGSVCEGWLGWGMAADDSGGAADAHLKTNWFADVWKNSDGSIYAVEIAAVVAQDWWSVPNKQRRNYNAELKDGARTIQAYANIAHPYHSQWITCQPAGGNNRGRRHWVGGAQPTLLYKPDRAYWISTKLVPPYDLSVNYSPVYVGSAGNATYVPCGSADHRADIDGTGAYPGRGLLSNPDAIAFVRQTAEDTAAARINGHTGLGVNFHYRANMPRKRPGESADVANTPVSLVLQISDGSAPAFDFTADGMPAPIGGDGGAYTYSAVAPGGGGVWFTKTADPSHAVNYSGGMYLLEGERYHLEASIDLAMNCVHQNAPIFDATSLIGAYRSDTGGSQYTNAYSEAAFGRPIPNTTFNGIAGLTVQRGTGWALNNIGFAAGMTPDSHVAKKFLKRFHLQQVLYLKACLAVTPKDAVAAGAMLIQQSIFDDAPWMDALVAIGCIHSANMTESADLMKFGCFKANMSLNMVTDGPYKTTMFNAFNLHHHGPVAAPKNPFGLPVNQFSTHPLQKNGIYAVIDTATNTILLHSPSQNDRASYPVGGIWPQVNDILYPGDLSPSPDFVPGTAYHIVNLTPEATGGRTVLRGQVSLTRGGPPIRLVTPSWKGTTSMTFDTDLAQYSAFAVAKGPVPGIPAADDGPSMHLAAIVMAHYAGYAPATIALANKQYTFLSSVSKAGWPAMSMKVPSDGAKAR